MTQVRTHERHRVPLPCQQGDCRPTHRCLVDRQWVASGSGRRGGARTRPSDGQLAAVVEQTASATVVTAAPSLAWIKGGKCPGPRWQGCRCCADLAQGS